LEDIRITFIGRAFALDTNFKEILARLIERYYEMTQVFYVAFCI
jgi:hypothetical protein